MNDIDKRVTNIEKDIAVNETIRNETYNKLIEIKDYLKELNQKVTCKIERISDNIDIFKTDFLKLKTEHTVCHSNKNKEQDEADNLRNNISDIKTTLSNMSLKVESLEKIKNKTESMLWKWFDRTIIIAIALLLALVSTSDKIKDKKVGDVIQEISKTINK